MHDISAFYAVFATVLIFDTIELFKSKNMILATAHFGTTFKSRIK